MSALYNLFFYITTTMGWSSTSREAQLHISTAKLYDSDVRFLVLAVQSRITEPLQWSNFAYSNCFETTPLIQIRDKIKRFNVLYTFG